MPIQPIGADTTTGQLPAPVEQRIAGLIDDALPATTVTSIVGRDGTTLTGPVTQEQLEALGLGGGGGVSDEAVAEQVQDGPLTAAALSASYVGFGPIPPDPDVAVFWADTETNPPTYKAWNGTTWVVSGGGGGGGVGDGINYTGAASDIVVHTSLTGDATARLVQTADGNHQFSDGNDDTYPRRAGYYFAAREFFDFGVGEPFSQGKYYFLIIGDPSDPYGENAEDGFTGPNAVHGYNLRVDGFAQINNSLSVFSEFQPYIVVGRKHIDNRYPSLRPEGFGEEVALGIANTTTDYFEGIRPGDTALRAYGAGPGAPNQTHRRILIGSNDGSIDHLTPPSLSVGADGTQVVRPLDFRGPAPVAAGSALPGSSDGWIYAMVTKPNGTRQRVEIPYRVSSVQVADSFAREDGRALNNADSGQMWFITKGSWQINNGGAIAKTLADSFAGAVIGTAVDHAVSVDATPSAGGYNSAWLGVRVTDGDANNMLIVSVTAGTGAVAIQKKQGGAYTTLASGSATWPNGSTHRFGAEAAGNVVTVTVDGSTVLTHTLTEGDASLFAGATNAGLLAFDTHAKYDNLKITTS